MSTKYESAELILKLYDLRREEVMRKARQWFFTFNPDSAQDIVNTISTENGAYYRMVVSYWDMACSFVNYGAIDEEMFNAANAEQNFVYAKVQPFIEELRSMGAGPQYLTHLEKVVMRHPEAEQRLAHLRQMARRMTEARAAQETARTEAEASNT